MADAMSRVDELLAALTLEEKVALTAGSDMWHTPPIERLGIPSLKVTDGPVGARGGRLTTGPPSACFPCGTALAATWDPTLVQRVGQELGAETRAKGAHVLLAPTVNIHRTPLAGRNFECYSEDPYLTARIAVAYIDGVQGQGVGACIKHFVCNDSELERFTMSSEVPERALREIYLRPFEVAIAEGRPLAVMGAYNKLGGTWCCEHPGLLTTILRDEWGFDGLVVSDWWATHTTVDAVQAGLDLEMPGPTLYRGEKLVAAVRSGDADEPTLDRAVRRVLALMERTGALVEETAEERAEDTPERRAIAREAARSAIVLLRNEAVDGSPVLPLAVDQLRSIAVVGPNADAPGAILGGGSAAVSPYDTVTILEGLQARLTGIDVRHEPGCSITRIPPWLDLRSTTTSDGEPGIAIEFVAGDDPTTGEPAVKRVTRRSAVTADGVDLPAWCARARTRFRPLTSGRHRFQLASLGQVLLFLDGNLVVDGWDAGDQAGKHRFEGEIDLVAGREYELRAELVPPPPMEGMMALLTGMELRCQPPLPEDALERAVQAASECDAVIVVVGTNGDWETEGHDRTTMAMPGRQEELICAVAAANPRTIVVVNAGAPVSMDWVESVPAVLQSWFLGQETGNALADVLTGDVDASGRLPTTIPRALRDTPAHGNYPGEFGHVLYGEGLFVGYRWYDERAIAPRFPFGHGLSYTTFDHGPLEVSVHGRSAQARLSVTNTGARAGAEVVQLYVADVEASVERPPKELKGFSKLHLEPGASETVTFDLDASAFAFWDPTEHRWRVEGGEFELQVGASVADIRQTATVTIAASEPPDPGTRRNE